MAFEWDEEKRQANLTKHGIDFELAEDAFQDTRRQVKPDNRRDYGEQRQVLLGWSEMNECLVVIVYTLRNEGDIRIISARKANPREQRIYG